MENDMDLFEEWYKARTSKIKEHMKANTIGMSMMMAVQKEMSNVKFCKIIFTLFNIKKAN